MSVYPLRRTVGEGEEMTEQELLAEVFGDEPPEKPVTFRMKKLVHSGKAWVKAEDVADLLETLGQFKTARHLRGQIYGGRSKPDPRGL